MRDAAQASCWADVADERRPARKRFKALIASEAARLLPSDGSILELGSGPGFLSRQILEGRPDATYTLLDWSDAMHDLARKRLGTLATRARFVTENLKQDGWETGLGTYDLVITLQTVHELRHKRHAEGLHRAVHGLLNPGGSYLVCDPYAGPGGMEDRNLFMTVEEQFAALAAAGYASRESVLEADGLVLILAR